MRHFRENEQRSNDDYHEQHFTKLNQLIFAALILYFEDLKIPQMSGVFKQQIDPEALFSTEQGYPDLCPKKGILDDVF